MAHTLYLSILFVTRLSTFNGPFIIWIFLIILCRKNLILLEVRNLATNKTQGNTQGRLKR